MKNSIFPLQIFAIIMAIAGTASLAFFYYKLDNAVYQNIKYHIEHDQKSLK
jgi:hypothetical protein